MKLFALLAVVLFAVTVIDAQQTTPVRLDAIVVVGSSPPGSCPASSVLDAARMNASAAIQQLFRDAPCGGLGWTQIISLDLGNAADMCPPPFIESPTPQRSCTAANNNNCLGFTSPVPGQYRRVCGRVFGYSVNTPDAFISGDETIDGPYLDGVSLTYGSPRQHIWSFAAGHGARFGPQNNRCPCVNGDTNAAPLPPAFVGNNYFCDNLDNGGELWDAMDCNNACCTFNSPPMFTATLPNPTSDGIEVRLCSDQNAGDETVHIRLIELYVQ